MGNPVSGETAVGETWLCDTPCPECRQRTVVGMLLVNERGEHMHTHYVCTFWRSGLNDDLTPAHQRCGWTGWFVPGWDDALPVVSGRTREQDS